MRGYKSFDSDVHPGQLRHTIEIGYTDNVINENGYPTPEDKVMYKLRAYMVDAGNQHFRASDEINAETVVNFTIRWHDGIVPGMWIKYRGRKYVITVLGEYDYKRRWLGMKAGVVEGVG